ncbi:site-specific integrase [Mycolicibacterium goodii]|uniref:tyrosine-type recombinase/integrase n=1 Tax=Mycolicibacterium goodii TaxID=134601 RepID=UPI001BDC26E4|nr:site-specific integrase [Mycolicibacterium goodii]MBU8820419.1 site-specific integrase [Mycolicibacterium goodii]
MSATVTAIATRRRTETPTVRTAVDEFLAAPRNQRSPHTARAYGNTLGHVAAHLGGDRLLAEVTEDQVHDALNALWGDAAPATWNRNRGIVASWLTWCATRPRWDCPAMPTMAERQRENKDSTQAMDRGEIDRLCKRSDIPLRERCLWRMLYETSSRTSAVLELNVEDLDMPNRRAKIRQKGGDVLWIAWGTDTARLLGRMVSGRASGPLFLSDRRPGPQRLAQTAASDIDEETGRVRLGYDRARTQFDKHSGGRHLHQLRHSSLTHLAEAGVPSTVLMAKSGHKSLHSLQRYVKPGIAAVAEATELLSSPPRRG